MQSPEILLQDLNTALRELRGAAHLLGDERLDAELLPTMRRLLLAEVLGNTWILAIGGSQGAGKTTLLRSLYSLDGAASQWLQPNEGRGEKLPVLVLEDASHDQIQGALRCLRKVGDQYQLVEEDVDVANFQKAVSDPSPEVLLPVLKVPQRYFKRPNQAWLLLPGYEKQDRENKAWQELMRQALVGAAGCVLVTDETRMANQQQVEIVKDMLANELRGSQALIVISKTEAARGKPERLQELRATAGKVYGLVADQTDRWVVFAGSDENGYIDEWLPPLRRAIEDLAISGGGDRKAQLARLEEVLSRDLTRALGLIYNKSQLFFQQRDGGEGGPREVLEACLATFDESKEKLRAEYQNGVTETLNQQFLPAWKQLEVLLVNKHEGIWNRVKGVGNTATEIQQRLESDVSESWGSSSILLSRHAEAIAKITQKELGAPKDLLDKEAPRLSQGSPMQQLGYVGIDNHPIPWKRPDDADRHNLRLVLAGRTTLVQTEQARQVTKDFERAVRLLPALTLEYARMASLMPTLVGVRPDSLMAASAAEQSSLMQQAVQQLGDGVTLGKTVLRSIATILAVDLATDGDVDVIPAFLNALNPGSAAAGGAAAGGTTAAGGAAAIGGIGAAVVGVVAIGYLTYSALQAVNLRDEKARIVAHSMLINIKEHHQKHFLSHFNQLMDQVRERLRQSLRERYHLDESLMEKDRLAKAIADVRALQRDLLDELGRSGRTITLFNVEMAA